MWVVGSSDLEISHRISAQSPTIYKIIQIKHSGKQV
jgi:hypothetical protein